MYPTLQLPLEGELFHLHLLQKKHPASWQGVHIFFQTVIMDQFEYHLHHYSIFESRHLHHKDSLVHYYNY